MLSFQESAEDVQYPGHVFKPDGSTAARDPDLRLVRPHSVLREVKVRSD